MATPASVKKITYQEWLAENEIEIVHSLRTACLNWLNQQANAVEHDAVDCLEISDKFIRLEVGGKKSKSKFAYKFTEVSKFLFVVTLNSFSRGSYSFNTGHLLKEYWNNGNPEIKKWVSPKKIIVKIHQKTPQQIEQELFQAQRCLEMDFIIFKSIRKCGESKYLSRKKLDYIETKYLRFAKGFIVLLIKDFNNDIRGFQKIYDENIFIDGKDIGNKIYTKFFKKEGSFIEINGQNQTVICEGFATGMTIHLATGFKVLCALDAYNLIDVAVALKERGETAIIAADNDVRKPTDKCQENTGIECAKIAAEKTGFSITYPVLNGQKCDFNDLHIAQGLNAVRNAF